MTHFVASMITNPAKLIEFPITVTQMTFDFVSKLLQLMVHA